MGKKGNITRHVREKEITDNEEYKLARTLMTIPRFCGLLNSDGHLTITYDKFKVQNPKIILTQTHKRIAWLYGVQDWLAEQNIGSSLLTPKKLKKSEELGSSINFTIDRENCRKLLDLIDKTEIENQTPLLFDKKRVSYLLLKESIKIRQSSKQKRLTEDQATKLVDIKESALKHGKNPQGLTRDQLIERLGFPNIPTKGSASSLIKETQEKVAECGDKVLKTVLADPKLLNPALAEFIVGIFDGDGSITVGLFTHISDDQKKIPGRHTFEIVPAIIVTTQKEKISHLLKIIHAAFGKGPCELEEVSADEATINNPPCSLPSVARAKKKPKSVSVFPDYYRLTIRDVKYLKEYAVPFFKKYPLLLKKNQLRFEVFCDTLQQLPLDYKNKKKIEQLICDIYAKDIYKRDKTLEAFLNIVGLDYS